MKTTRQTESRIEPGPPTPIPPDPSPTPGEPVPPLPDPDPSPDPEPGPDRASVLLRFAELPRAARERALAGTRRGAIVRGGIVRFSQPGH